MAITASTQIVDLCSRVSSGDDGVRQFADFDPRRDYALTLADTELTLVERNARAGVATVDDIDLG